MKIFWQTSTLCLCAALVLSACGPGPGYNRANDTSTAALSGTHSRGFLGLLRHRDDPAPAPPDELAGLPAASEQPGNLQRIPSMTDEQIAAAGALTVGAPEPSRRPRLFGFLRKRAPGEGPAAPATVGAPEPTVVADDPPGAEPSMSDVEIAAAGRVTGSAPTASRRPRLFGFLNNRSPRQATAPAPVVLAAAPPPAQLPDIADDPMADPQTPRSRGGLFGRPGIGRSDNAPSASYNPTLLLPFGEVLRVCDAKKRELGTEVARAHSSAFRLYDSDPSSTLPRSQFLTGFNDGCARQFTAALALFGAPAVHEATRYSANNTAPYSQIDAAYEKIKNRICGVGNGQNCPESRSAKLEKETAFVTIYSGFGSTAEWVEVFLHKGEVVTYQTQRR